MLRREPALLDGQGLLEVRLGGRGITPAQQRSKAVQGERKSRVVIAEALPLDRRRPAEVLLGGIEVAAAREVLRDRPEHLAHVGVLGTVEKMPSTT